MRYRASSQGLRRLRSGRSRAHKQGRPLDAAGLAVARHGGAANLDHGKASPPGRCRPPIHAAYDRSHIILVPSHRADMQEDQGQGAGQALEDAAALSIVLPRGTAPEAISERLKLYEEIRYERAHSIQQFSREAGRDWTNGMPPLNSKLYPLCLASFPGASLLTKGTSGVLYQSQFWSRRNRSRI